ncbi:MAG: dynamin family protein [Phototrophicaceae bacterium]
MSNPSITVIEGKVALLREEEIQLLNALAETLGKLGLEQVQDDQRRLRDVAADLGEMFFLVAVIGEFNAGKSTFINALLGEPLLPMGITPTTEMIELIRYSEEPQRKPITRDDHKLRLWGHPNTGAPGIAIVDTPGTGSVFAQHDEIAKDFLHRSDLVMFVTSAKRAFAETDRLYLDLARNYGKKTVLIVNQIDLLNPDEWAEVRKFVARQVKESLGFEPLIFGVSARQALNGQDGGMDGVRAHLRGVFAEAPPTQQKLLAQLDLTERVIARYRGQIETETGNISRDTLKVRHVQEELDKHAVGLSTQFKETSVTIERIFAELGRRGHAFIDENLSIRQLLRRPGQQALQNRFQDEVIGRSLREINEATNSYINSVIDSSRLYWRGVIDRLNQLREMLDQDVGGLDANAYAEQRAGLEEAIRIAKTELESYSNGQVIRQMQGIFEGNINAFAVSSLTTVSGLIALAAIIIQQGGIAAALAGASVIVIAVAAPLAVGGVIAGTLYYQRVQADTHREFDSRVEQLVKSYHDSLDDLTIRERERLKKYGNQVLTPIFSRLGSLESRYQEQQRTLQQHQQVLERLRQAIQSLGP